MKLFARPKKKKMDYTYIILAIVMSVFILYQESLYKVKNDDQVILIQLFWDIAPPITEAGTYFKIPFIQQAYYYPKNNHFYKNDHEIKTRDRKLIKLHTQAVWKLVDPIKFYNRFYDFTDQSIYFIEQKIQSAEIGIINTTKLIDIVLKFDDATSKNLGCNPEVLHRIEKEAQSQLREFGILLLNIKATVSFPV